MSRRLRQQKKINVPSEKELVKVAWTRSTWVFGVVTGIETLAWFLWAKFSGVGIPENPSAGRIILIIVLVALPAMALQELVYYNNLSSHLRPKYRRAIFSWAALFFFSEATAMLVYYIWYLQLLGVSRFKAEVFTIDVIFLILAITCFGNSLAGRKHDPMEVR